MFYKLDSTRVSLREYWWGTPNPLVIFAWLIKWLRIRLPGSVDDPNVDSLEPFRISPDQLPEGARAKFHAVHGELQDLGFHSPVCYWIHDVTHQTDIYQAVYLHNSGQTLVRVHHRVWHYPKPAREYFFPVFLTAFSDGTYLISTAGKRDVLAPPVCRENRQVAATATDLWTSHQNALQEELLFKTVRPVRDERELLETVESHHAIVRDFHVNRGVFVPMSADEEQIAMEAAQTAAEAVAEGGEIPSQSSAVLDEIEKLQNKRSGWGAGLILLIVSVGLFLALGVAHWSLEFVAMLLPILFFHELGHYAAMRLFHYSNVKMFFIPLLGAAVSGRHYNVPGWKKVIVSLAGPLPGIFLAAGLGGCAAWYRIDWLHNAAMLAIFLNGFNLLPILPLDGGWVVHALLFSRHYILDAGFRVLAVVILLTSSFLIGDNFLFFFGVVMAAGLPVAFRMAGVVSAVRRQGISTASPDDQSIPPETAQAIADEIRSRFPQTLANKNVAQFTLQAFEALNARPPGLIATILLGGAYLGSFLFALIAVAVLAVGLPMFMEPDFTPSHPIEVGQIEIAGRDRGVDVPAGEVTIVATFADADAAAARFAEFKEQMPDDTTLLQFGESLLVAVPPDGQLTPDQWESRLASQTLVVFNPADSLTIGFSVAATAPSEEVAAQIQDALKTYQLCSVWIAPNPPWHPDSAPTAEQQQARELFVKLTETEDVYDDPRHERFDGQLTEAYENGDEDRLGKLREEMDAVRKAIREERLDRIREEAIDPREQELIALYQRQPVFDPEPDVPIQSDEPVPEPVREAREKASREYRERLNVWQGELAESLGGTRREPDRMVSKADRFTLEGGTIERNGRMLQIEYAELFWPADAAPAFIRWLDEQGCTEMKYSFLGE